MSILKPAAPDVLGFFRPLAAGFAIAGVTMLAWPGLTVPGVIYAGAGLLVALSIGNGLKALAMFAIGALVINSAVIPLATEAPDFNNPLGDVALPNVTIDADPAGAEAETNPPTQQPSE